MTRDPDHPYPYRDARCDVAGCTQPSATVSWYAGRRCRIHRPRFSPAVATAMDQRGWPDTAAAYRRRYGKEAS
jgi:hypothetical protein